MLPTTEAKESYLISFTSLGYRWKQHCVLLNLFFFVKTIFLKGINRNKEGYHKCWIINFLKILPWRDPSGSAADHDVANKDYVNSIYDYLSICRSYPAVNALWLVCWNKSVFSVKRNNFSLFWYPYKTQIYNLWTECWILEC
jgi:hypothetical protein